MEKKASPQEKEVRRMSFDQICERFFIPLKMIDSYLTHSERMQLQNTSVCWRFTMEDLHFGEHAVVEIFLIN